MSLRIVTDRVIGVLLADGWHKVKQGTFDLDSYEYVDSYEDSALLLLPGGSESEAGVPATGFCFQEYGVRGQRMAGPISSILAVEYASPNAAPQPVANPTEEGVPLPHARQLREFMALAERMIAQGRPDASIIQMVSYAAHLSPQDPKNPWTPDAVRYLVTTARKAHDEQNAEAKKAIRRILMEQR